MARFTDEIVGFNPYIAQVPVDDYVRVGMIKQQQYNEGVQKVQSYIDSVAGIDVIKPEQKEYLQSRVSQLQGEVGKIVSEDFSNQQIVNSVGNLTSKIAGDPIIQNAVLSTQRYRQGLADMKDAKEKGLASPSNEYVFQKQVQDWLGDHDAKSTFTGDYERFTDTKKPILEAINALKPGADIRDIPYETDAAGNYVLDSHGGRKIAYAILREKLEGVPEGRVRMAIEASITPQMKRQFEIDGMYNYRGLDKVGLKKVADASYNNRFGKINDIVQGLTTQLNANQNDDSKKKAIQNQLKAYDLQARELQAQYRQDIDALDKDPEGYKGELNFQDEMAKYSLGYSWSKHSLTYEKNPLFDGVMKEKAHELNWQKLLETSAYHQGMLKLKEEEINTRKLALTLKYGKGTGLGLDSPVFGPIDQEKLESINISTITKEVENLSNDIDQQKLKLIGQLQGGDAWIENRNGQLIYKSPEAKAAAETALKTMKEAYDKDPSSVSPAAQTFFRNSNVTDGLVKNFQATADNIIKDANAKFPITPLLKGLSSIQVKTSDGSSATMSPEEQADLAAKFQNFTASMRQANPELVSFSDIAEIDRGRFLAGLSPKERAVIESHTKNSGRTEDDINISHAFGKTIQTINSGAAADMASQRAEFIKEQARRAYMQQQQQTQPIMAYKPETETRAKAIFVQILNDQKVAGKDNPNPLYDRKDISEMLDAKNFKNTTYSLHTNPDGTKSLRMSNTSISDKPREMDITDQQAEALFGSYVNEFKPIQQAIDLSKYNGVSGTTDVRRLGRESAYNITPSVKLQNYSVKYHVEEPSNGQYQVKLYIYDKKNKEWMPETYIDLGGRMMTPEQVTAAINNLSDSEIDRIKKNGPSASPVAPASYGQQYTGPDTTVDKEGIHLSEENQDEEDQSDDNE